MLLAAFAALLATHRLGRYTDIPVAALALAALGGLLVGVARRVRGVPWRDALALGGLVAPASPCPLGSSGSLVQRAQAARLVALLLVSGALVALAGEGLSVRGEDFVADHPELAGRLGAILAGSVANPTVLAWAALLLILAILFAVEASRCRTPRLE